MKKILVLSALLLFSCGGKNEGKEPIVEIKLNGIEQKGRDIYAQYCISCHQADGRGKVGLSPSINNPDFLGIASDDVIRKTILHGRAGTPMAPFKLIPNVEQNLPNLLAYIRSWERGYPNLHRVQLDPYLEIKGDEKEGHQIFSTYCAACHGAKGEGYMAGLPGTAIGLKGFLKIVPDDYIKQTLIRGRAGTPMRSFQSSKGLANLSEEELNNVVAYLRSLK